MNNFMAFLSWLASYAVVYFVFIGAILIAFAIGFSVRKNKNKKESGEVVIASQGEASSEQYLININYAKIRKSEIKTSIHR